MGTGGARYGAGRPGWRRKCENMLRFDLTQLKRKGKLSAGQSYGWAWFCDGEKLASIGVRTFADRLVLEYTRTISGQSQRITCNVWLTQVPCTFGGWRQYFICPDCGRLSLVLFGLSPRANFACRVCQRLAYASEAETPIDRCWRRQRKIEIKLADDRGRPKGMRRRTFERLCRTWEAIEERKDELFLPGFLQLARRLGIDCPT
jgi:hypothetical protein